MRRLAHGGARPWLQPDPARDRCDRPRRLHRDVEGLIDRNGKPTDFSDIYAASELTWQGKPAHAYDPALQHEAEKAAIARSCRATRRC